jgi:hypothetical protein
MFSPEFFHAFTLADSYRSVGYKVPESTEAAIVKGREESLAYTTKETYLEWVRQWKVAYATLSQESRVAKRNRKQSLPTFDVNAVRLVKELKQKAKLMLWLRAAGKGRARYLRSVTLKEASVEQPSQPAA